MTQPTRDKLRAIFPRFSDEELDVIHERLKRYVLIALDIVKGTEDADALTRAAAGATVKTGQVDPSTFTKSG